MARRGISPPISLLFRPAFDVHCFPEVALETRPAHCPNCSAPLDLPLGETEASCAFCGSRLRWVPSTEELEVVRTREEMKYRERVAVQQELLRKRLKQEEASRWREAAAKVAIAAAPAVGSAAARTAVRVILGRAAGVGCGCLLVLWAAAILFAALLHILWS